MRHLFNAVIIWSAFRARGDLIGSNGMLDLLLQGLLPTSGVGFIENRKVRDIVTCFIARSITSF